MIFTRKVLLSISALAIGVMAFATSTFAQDRTYPLSCMPGSGMTLSFGSMVKPNRDIYAVLLKLQFQHGANAAGNARPAPGTCSWLDRGMRPDEPRQAILRFERGVSFNIECDHNGACGSEVFGIDPAFRYIRDRFFDGEPFTLIVHTDRTWFEIDRYGS